MISTVLVVVASLAITSAHPSAIHKICVPRVAVEACKKMSEDGKAAGVNIECFPARDRVDCIYKVRSHEADFQAVEPEDMYIAANLDNDAFTVFKEIRTREEPRAEFRYEAVAVVHKDLDIPNLKALKGLKSCHTGVGRNVGYKIPITKLTNMGILPPLNDTSLSPRENELKALSSLFSKACLVGKWSPHPETNTRLKQTYSNLCELCQHPDKCDYPDDNSGYEGALRCLAKAGGQIAFTKVIFVKKFFGLAYGTQPAKQSEFNPDEFAYLCPDATKRPITGPACTWASRPWPGYAASTHVGTEEIEKLRQEIASLNNIGEDSHADWLAKVLLLSNKTISIDNVPNSPLSYLEKAKYKDVIERDVLKPSRLVRICTQTAKEMEKCKLLQLAAYSRDIRPSLACIQSDNCYHAVHNKEAELVVLDPHQAFFAEERHHLKPIINEMFNNQSQQDVVATVLKGSQIDSIQQLKGKKACLPPNNSAGFFGIIKYLLKNNYIAKTHCPYEQTLTEFFSSISTSVDPIECLEKGEGDVAFVPVSSLYQNGKKNVELICPTGGKAPIEKTNCGLVTIPPRLIMTCKELSDVQVDEARQSLLSAGNLYAKEPALFQLFGRFDGVPNVLFSDHANGLVAIADVLPSFEEYKKLVVDLNHCKF